TGLMSRTEGQGRAWSLWLVGVLLVLRLVIAPWGGVLIFNNSVDFMAEAKLPIGDLIMGRYPGIVWPQPGSYPVLLKLLGTTQPDDPVTRKAILVFNVLLSTATLGLVSLAGRRIFPGERARVG